METEEKKIYTIEDIARELGVSKTTVSRAISGKGRISQATRDRVRAFIKEHDYRPNVVAKGLAQRKTYNIALLMPKDYVATEFLFFKDCMNGICEMASSYDYDIIISMIDGADVSQIQRLEANRKVDGIIVSRAVVSSKVQKYLKNCKEPYILIGPSSDPEVPFVDNKNREAGKELTSIMLMKGFRNLALLGGNQSYNVTGSRYQGFLEAHEEMGVSVNENLIFMDTKLVIFDLDGTLLDTLEDLRDSTNHVLRQMGYPERSLEEMRRFVGNGAEKQIRRAVPEGTSEEKIMETLAAYRAYYQDHCQIKTRVYDGLLDMLSELKAKGIKLAVVSNKPDSAVQKLSREYFGDRMDFAVGPSDGVRCKPYPDMAETALKALGIAKKDAVFVGDSEVDVQTGLNAGLDVIAVSWGFRSREVVIEAGAKMIADDASELEKLILE